jgi:hypothetical protein
MHTYVYKCISMFKTLMSYLQIYACVYMCVCIYILLYVQRYIHVQNIHVHTVCTYRGMCACAPCPPQHDSPLTPPLQQDEWTPLHASASCGHKDATLALLQAGAAVDAKTEVRVAIYLYVYAYICVHTYICV